VPNKKRVIRKLEKVCLLLCVRVVSLRVCRVCELWDCELRVAGVATSFTRWCADSAHSRDYCSRGGRGARVRWRHHRFALSIACAEVRNVRLTCAADRAQPRCSTRAHVCARPGFVGRRWQKAIETLINSASEAVLPADDREVIAKVCSLVVGVFRVPMLFGVTCTFSIARCSGCCHGNASLRTPARLNSTPVSGERQCTVVSTIA
jgi:hypothetical protein